MPVGTHSRDQLIALEEKQDNATGFLKKYYDFMKRLTGKRPIKTYEVDKKEQFGAAIKAEEIKPPAQEVNFTNSTVFNKMIKG